MQLVEALAAQLDRSFEQGDSPQDIYYARWLLFRRHQEQSKALILRLMNNGWLPDYNAKMYPKAIMTQLFMETGLGVKAYQVLLQKNREQVTAGFEQING